MQKRVKDTILQMNAMGEKGEPFMFMIDYGMNNAHVFAPVELSRQGIFMSTPGFQTEHEKAPAGKFSFSKIPIDFERYERAFSRVMEAINRGDTFLLNLTFPTQLDTDLSLEQIFRASTAKYRLKFKDRFVVFSPEPFLIIKGNIISSFPMKGTMDASIEGAEHKLLNDIKEVSEHNTIVDLIRNDLSMVAKKVRVEKFRYVERIKTHERELLQTSSMISGELQGDWRSRVGDLVLRLLPAGSISGAPKQMTMEIIEAAEGYERGWFSGVFGYFDGNDLESAVMIRYIEQLDGKLVFKSGGGITHFSNCRQEYDEMVGKVYLPFA